MIAQQILPPDSTPASHKVKIFLAGTIDMGNSVDWQAQTLKALAEYPVSIYNPRRNDWDASWEQVITNDKFTSQVNWELDSLDNADIAFFNFLPKSLSPITLMEFGFYAPVPNKCIVICPDDFWRKGNVEIGCARHNVTLYHDFDRGLAALKTRIRKLTNT